MCLLFAKKKYPESQYIFFDVFLTYKYLQEAEEAAAAEVLKLQQELELEEAGGGTCLEQGLDQGLEQGLEPHPEEDEDLEEEDDIETEQNVDEIDNKLNLSDQQSYQLYVVESKGGDLENANLATETGADTDDNNTLLSEEEGMSESDPLRRRRVRVIKRPFYQIKSSHILKP